MSSRFSRWLPRALAISLVLPLLLVVDPWGETASATPKPVAPTERRVLFEVAEASALGGRATSEVSSTTSEVDVSGGVKVVGVTWSPGRAPEAVQYRERIAGTWGDWHDMPGLVDTDHAPDAGTGEAARAVVGTDPVIVIADGLQLRARAATKAALAASEVNVIDPGSSPADSTVTSAPAGSANAAALAPSVRTRAEWGADESLRKGTIDYGVVRAMSLHHTVGANDYTAAQVPAIIRGIYAFHTQNRGWNDIGYNAIVDRFGVTWEGRKGGIDRPVQGAHTLGVNSQTSGVSVLGTYGSTPPSAAAQTALAKFSAWKLALTAIDPLATTTLSGAGSTSTIIGHRDAYATECPGEAFYARLPAIRSAARAYQGTMIYPGPGGVTSSPYQGSGIELPFTANRRLTYTVTVTSPCVSADIYRATRTVEAGSFTARWPGTTETGYPAPPGPYVLTVEAASGSTADTRATTITRDVVIESATGAPNPYCGARLAGENRYATAVNVAKQHDPSAQTVVLVGGEDAARPDALVAAPLAVQRSGVLLLTESDRLSPETAVEIARRKATKVVIVGGASRVSAAVVATLEASGTQVTRVSGGNRYQTAAAVARAMGPNHPSVYLASGANGKLVDGLALSGTASAAGAPILYLSRGSVPGPTQAALDESNTAATFVAGGSSTISDDVLTQLPRPTRLAGANRYGTAVAIANAHPEPMPVEYVVASGENSSLVDLLSAGQMGQPMLMVRQSVIPDATAAWVRANASRTPVIVGGDSSVGAEVIWQLSTLRS